MQTAALLAALLYVLLRMKHSLHWSQAASNWLLCSNYLIQDNTKAEDVSLLCTSACGDQLWSHPVEGASILQ